MNAIEDVKAWVKSMGEKGIYGGAAARLRATAIEQLSSVVGADEKADPATLLKNIESVAKRWATKNRANPGTANTYLSRARSTLKDYIAFQNDPTKFPAGKTGMKRNGSGRRKEDDGASDGHSHSQEQIHADPGEQRFVFTLSTG